MDTCKQEAHFVPSDLVSVDTLNKCQNNINITKDVEFNEANQLYEVQCTELKKPGLTKTEPSIKKIIVLMQCF